MLSMPTVRTHMTLHRWHAFTQAAASTTAASCFLSCVTCCVSTQGKSCNLLFFLPLTADSPIYTQTNAEESKRNFPQISFYFLIFFNVINKLPMLNNNTPKKILNIVNQRYRPIMIGCNSFNFLTECVFLLLTIWVSSTTG